MRFLIWFVLFWAGALLVWSLIVWGQRGNPTRMSQWIADAYSKKERIARAIPGKKIVIVAGSNALFGVNSQMLSDAFGLPVVNDSVNAGVELPCILYMAKRVISQGDIVIMPLEYPMYSYAGRPGIQMIDFILSRRPALFGELTFAERFYMLWHIPLERLFDGYLYQGGEAISQGLYGAHHIDVCGDQNETEVIYRTEAMETEVRAHSLKPETYGRSFDAAALGWDYLEKFVQWCKEREVKVIFMPSTLMFDESYYNDPKEQWFYTHIAKEVRRHGWVYVGNPYDVMYQASLYFNTNFHLIDRGRRIRTRQMIMDLNVSGMVK